MSVRVGSPFHIGVIDPSKASARGDGLDLVQCNQTASFWVTAPAAQLKDFDIKIIGKTFSIVEYNDAHVLIIVIITGNNQISFKSVAVNTAVT